MIQSLKYNNSLRQRAKPYSKLKEELRKSNYKLQFIDKDLSASELNVIKDQIRERIRREQRRNDIILGTLALLLGAIFLFVLSALIDPPTPTPRQVPVDQEQAEIDKRYSFFIEDGKRWLAANEFHNAIFQFIEATKLKPSKYEGHLWLAIALTRRCSVLQEDCDRSSVQVDFLFERFPERQNETIEALVNSMESVGDSLWAEEIKNIPVTNGLKR